MTISYQADVSLATWKAFFKLLFRWKASIWKVILKDFVIWMFCFLLIAIVVQSPYFLTMDRKRSIQQTARLMDTYLHVINLTFILGIFVSSIAVRWENIIKNLGFIESLAISVSNYIRGDDEETRLQRRSIVRYACLAQVLVLRDISVAVKQRFANLNSVVEAGFLLEHEKRKLESTKTDYDKYWVPFCWTLVLIRNLKHQLKIEADIFVIELNKQLMDFRANLQTICNYDRVPLPLAYPQMVCVSVYFYFGVCLVSRQYVSSDQTQQLTYLNAVPPLMTIAQLILYIGWMKVALNILNPFGCDDDDFECNFLIDRNLITGLWIVDQGRNDIPQLQADLIQKTGKEDEWNNGNSETIPSIFSCSRS